MSKNNFINEKTGETYYISYFSTTVKNGSLFYKGKDEKEITNEEGVRLVPIPKEGTPMLARFDASTPEGQVAIKSHFTGRANKFDTKGAGRDEKDTRLGDFKSAVMERAKEGRL